MGLSFPRVSLVLPPSSRGAVTVKSAPRIAVLHQHVGWGVSTWVLQPQVWSTVDTAQG
jgi:hypothetical protein